jgi:hypothetical protein
MIRHKSRCRVYVRVAIYVFSSGLSDMESPYAAIPTYLAQIGTNMPGIQNPPTETQEVYPVIKAPWPP